MNNMTNEEKVISILQQFGIIAQDLDDERRNVVIEHCKNHMDYNMLLEMAKWKDAQIAERSVDLNYLISWYISSIDETAPPIWTDEHLEELLKDFYLIPKSND